MWHPIIADCQDDLADLFSFYLIALGQRSFYSIGNQVREKSNPVHVQFSCTKMYNLVWISWHILIGANSNTTYFDSKIRLRTYRPWFPGLLYTRVPDHKVLCWTWTLKGKWEQSQKPFVSNPTEIRNFYNSTAWPIFSCSHETWNPSLPYLPRSEYWNVPK